VQAVTPRQELLPSLPPIRPGWEGDDLGHGNRIEQLICIVKRDLNENRTWLTSYVLEKQRGKWVYSGAGGGNGTECDRFVLTRGLRRVLDVLVTEALLQAHRQQHGDPPPLVKRLLTDFRDGPQA
jgi:hypothetical protein